MKKWTKPMAGVEIFEANDSVSACYIVKCEIGQGNAAYSTWYGQRNDYRWNGEYPEGTIGIGDMLGASRQKNDLDHSADCGQNTMLNDNGSVYENYKWSTGNVASGVVLKDDVGKYICWYTDLKRKGQPDLRYYHFGLLQNADPAHKNMS